MTSSPPLILQNIQYSSYTVDVSWMCHILRGVSQHFSLALSLPGTSSHVLCMTDISWMCHILRGFWTSGACIVSFWNLFTYSLHESQKYKLHICVCVCYIYMNDIYMYIHKIYVYICMYKYIYTYMYINMVYCIYVTCYI